jgi:hypothetical protein
MTMPAVGRAFYAEIIGLPTCAREGCIRKASRRGSTVESEFCRTHYRDEISRLLATGMPFHEIRAKLWAERPRIKLRFRE